MKRPRRAPLRILGSSKPLVVGFLPENDCAPVVMAHELGLYRKHGLAVELQRESNWKSLHDKLIGRELDAAHAPATLPFLTNLGLTRQNCACVTGMVLSLQGNAITISRELWNRGVRDAATLGEHISRERRKRTYTFGVACPLASQYSLLCQWLRSAEIHPGSELRIVPISAWEMFPMLKLGYLDGYCAGEPWTSVAVQAGVGVCVATSSLLAPLHPEKILLVRRDFAQNHAREHERLIAALLEACFFCDQPENRRQLCQLLAQPHYVNAPVECLEAGLLGPFGPEDSPIHSLQGLNIFHRYRANEPTAARAAWLTGRLYEFFRWEKRPAALDNVFRRDIFRRALRIAPGPLASARPPHSSSRTRILCV